MGRGVSALCDLFFGHGFALRMLLTFALLEFFRRGDDKMEIPAAKAIELLLHKELNAIEAGKPFGRRLISRLYTIDKLRKGCAKVIAERVDIIRLGVAFAGRREQERFDARRFGPPEFDAPRPRLPHQHEAAQIAMRAFVRKRFL